MTRAGGEIVNPRTGQRLHFLLTSAETNGELLQMDCIHPAHSPRELEHLHPWQENRFEVHRGALTFFVDGREQRVGEGISIPPGTPHYFWNPEGEPAHYLQEFAPALRIEVFFETAFSIARDGKLGTDGRPAFLQLAVLMQAFRQEFSLTRPSRGVQRFIRAFAPLGYLAGYRDDYSPTPARRPSVLRCVDIPRSFRCSERKTISPARAI